MKKQLIYITDPVLWAQAHAAEIMGQVPIKRGLSCRTKGKIARVISAASFLLLLGVIGGMERDYVSLDKGLALAAICLIVFAISAAKGGLFRR